VTLHQAAVMVVGANIGTTITVGLGALDGVADKKRLALAHFLFNVITGIFFFAFVEQLLSFTISIFPVQDPLIDLVVFNTIIKFVGVIVFLPFLGELENWLRGKFHDSEPKGVTLYIKNVSTQVPEVAIAAVEKEVNATFYKTAEFLAEPFNEEKNHKIRGWRRIVGEVEDPVKKYTHLKQIEDELTDYHIALQEEALNEEDAEALTALMLSLRAMIYSAKDMKDILHNIREMDTSGDELAVALLRKLSFHVQDSIADLERLLALEDCSKSKLQAWLYSNESTTKEINFYLYQELRKNRVEGLPVSTLSNVIRQTSSSLQNLGEAVRYWKFRHFAAVAL